MEAKMMFLDCPAYLDKEHTVRCGLPGEVRRRFTMRSTDGLLESAMIRCPSGHWFNGPIEFLACDSRDEHHSANGAVADGVRSAGLTASHDAHAGQVRPAAQEFPGEPRRALPRTSCAPAYYLGRPARQWITAMRPRRRQTASSHLIQAGLPGVGSDAGRLATPQELEQAVGPYHLVGLHSERWD
jgi:hypothetical protein